MPVFLCRIHIDEHRAYVGYGMSEGEALQEAYNVAHKADPDLKEERCSATIRKIIGPVPARFKTRLEEEQKEEEKRELPPPKKGRGS